MELIDEYKFNKCDDTFATGDYNFEIFQHSMEKIFEEERKEQEAKENLEKEKNPHVQFSLWDYSFNFKDNFFFWFSVLFTLLSMGTLGYQYFNIKSLGGPSASSSGSRFK